jgi:adenine-specific DNA-methyltransferase
MDFFDYPVSNKFDTIIGNPPYVRFQDIGESTKQKLDMSLFDNRSNLFLFFISKCLDHLNEAGELIFIVPRELLKATAARKLNERLYEQGTITDIRDTGDEPIFAGAAPNCIIFRFEKGNMTHMTGDGRHEILSDGQLIFSRDAKMVRFSDFFYVKVGAVSGADRIFASANGNKDFVCSKTHDTGETRRMWYNTPSAELERHKDELMARRIRKFDENNWFEWGRGYYESDEERVYVNCKTRKEDPFYYHTAKAYDGSVLAVLPRKAVDASQAAEIASRLNSVDWEELGFKSGGRYLFSQKSLEGTMIPASAIPDFLMD